MSKALELAELGQFLAVDANGDITFNKDLDVDTITSGNVDITGNIAVTGNVDGRDLSTDGTKLDTIESNATADQTDAEIKTAYENNSDTNALTDANLTKLNSIESNATADQTDAEIKTAYENNSDTNALTDANLTKLNSIESNATADQTDAEIKTAYENNSDTNALTDANLTKLNGIEALADVTDATNVASAGALMSANNLSDLANATTARTNLDVDQAGEALAFSIALG